METQPKSALRSRRDCVDIIKNKNGKKYGGVPLIDLLSLQINSILSPSVFNFPGDPHTLTVTSGHQRGLSKQN